MEYLPLLPLTGKLHSDAGDTKLLVIRCVLTGQIRGAFLRQAAAADGIIMHVHHNAQSALAGSDVRFRQVLQYGLRKSKADEVTLDLLDLRVAGPFLRLPVHGIAVKKQIAAGDPGGEEGEEQRCNSPVGHPHGCGEIPRNS